MDSEQRSRNELALALTKMDERLNEMRGAFAQKVVAALRGEIAAEQRRRRSAGIAADEPMTLNPGMVLRVMLAVDEAANTMYGKARGDGGGQLGNLIDESTKEARRRVWDLAAQETRDAISPRRLGQLQAAIDDIRAQE